LVPFSPEPLGLSSKLREEQRLRVYEKRMLRRMFGPRRDEVTGGWRKLHSEELHTFYSSPCLTECSNKEDVLGRACSMKEGEKLCIYDYWWESQKEIDHLKDQDISG
jgi:hypothetical protein